jgi:3-phenylpropionate/trans-cinnamate dioxygenase ferredoxin component
MTSARRFRVDGCLRGKRRPRVGWIKACTLDDVKPGETYKIETEPPITLFNDEGQLFALDDTCTHGLSSLSEGYVEDGEVECIWHYARFDLRTGRALCLPATVGLQTYPVAVDGGTVLVDIPDSILAASSLDDQRVDRQTQVKRA